MKSWPAVLLIILIGCCFGGIIGVSIQGACNYSSIELPAGAVMLVKGVFIVNASFVTFLTAILTASLTGREKFD